MNHQKKIKEYIRIFLYLFWPAWTINQILVPSYIVSGELTGLCETIYFATNTYIPIWLSSLVLNTLLIIIAIYLMGWKFCIRTIYGIIGMTFWLKIIPICDTPVINHPILGILAAGLINGIGLGLIFNNNGNSGGTDIIALIVNKYSKLSIGTVLFICDFIIIGCSWFLPQVNTLKQLFLGLSYTLISSSIVNLVTKINKIKKLNEHK